MSIIKRIRKQVANVIYKNAISLPNEFLKYGNPRMRGNWSDIEIDDKDHYEGYSYAIIKKRKTYTPYIAIDNVRTESSKNQIHPYLEAIKNSKSFSEFEFWSQISLYLDLEGVYYLMAVRAFDGYSYGDLQYFKLLNPYNIKKIVSPSGIVGGYVERKENQYREIPKQLIIEIRETNPFDWNKPFAMTDGSKSSQFNLKASSTYTRDAINGNINARGILSTEIQMDDGEFQNFVNRVRRHIKGEPLFANGSGAIKWDSMEQDMRSAALDVVNAVNRDELFAVGGVSKTIMGVEQSGVTRDTAKVQRELFIEGEILPRIQLIIDALNLDYRNSKFKDEGIKIVVDNPNATDLDAEQKESDLKRKDFELYNSLIEKGYDPNLSAMYINGDITIDKLGEPKKVQQQEPKQQTNEVKEINYDDIENKIHNQLENTLVVQQQGSLQNAIVNVEGNVVATMISKLKKRYSKTANNALDENSQILEEDLISKYEKKQNSSELGLVIATFYGVIISYLGKKFLDKRVKDTSMDAKFTFNSEIKNYLKVIAEKSSTSHVNTIVDDILSTARQEALKGKSVDEIVSAISTKYSSEVTNNRAKTIARTETNRAFTRSQYEADKQFIEQNKLQGRVYKKWVTRSQNPCEFCQELASRPPILFSQAFVDLGSHISVDGKDLGANFETVEAGTLHPNCSCAYEIIIEPAKNQIEKQQNELIKEKEEHAKTMEELQKLVNEALRIR